jgi:hypothetical protein
MQKLLLFFILFSAAPFSPSAQVIYRFSFPLQAGGGEVPCTAFFVDNGNGNAQVRVRFNAPGNSDSTLVDFTATEEPTDKLPGCASSDILYLRMQKVQVLSGTDNTISFPAYLCFRMNKESGYFEPAGYSNDIGNCQQPVTAFTSAESLAKKDISKETVSMYFRPSDSFYAGYFASTRDFVVIDPNTTLHLLVVANTFDDHIGSACAKDMRRAIKFFQELKDFLGIRFVFDTIAGKRYSVAQVDAAIAKLSNAGPNDIIVFYYTGHGFRQKDDNRRPPYIDLRPNYDENPNNLNSKSLADIFQSISGMKARFKLVWADCCNDMSRTYSVKAKAPSATKGFGLNGSLKNGADLFLNAKRLSILATGANPGQRSICNDDFGGFFSYNFLNSIEGQLSFLNSNANWDKIMEETGGKTRKLAMRVECATPANANAKCTQIPYFEKAAQ